MSLPRIYYSAELQPGLSIKLQDSAARHVGLVLRLEVNHTIILFNGDGADYLGKITEIHKKNISILVHKKIIVTTESPLYTHLGQAISRGEKMDWVIQKAVELGANAITPLITSHCAIKYNTAQLEKKFTHWQGIIISACEQSGRNIMPVLYPAQKISDWLKNINMGTESTALVFDPESTTSLKSLHLSPNKVSLLIGPEGGLSPEEVLLAKQHKFHSVKLGKRILRTETAAIAALSAVQSHWGDF